MLNKLGFDRTSSAVKETGSLPADQAAQERQFLAKNREMVRVAVKGTLKEYGLDATWVGCSVLLAPAAEPGRTVAESLEIRLIVQVWREELMRFLPALQAKIVQAIAGAAPGFDRTRHAVTWQFAQDCGCPVTDLPPPERWRAKPPAQQYPVASTASAAPKRRFDLPPSELDQVRDERDDIPSIFAASQPGFVDTLPIDWPKPCT